MVTPKSTAIFLVLLWVWMLSRSRYRKPVLAVFTVYVVYLAIKMFFYRYQRPAEIKAPQEARSLMEHGDLLHISSAKLDRLFTIPFTMGCMFLNEYDIHTAYVIEHQSKLYVLNSYGTVLFNRRRPYYRDPESVEVLASNALVTIFMEPLDEFLRVESRNESYVTMIKTEKKAPVFDVGQKRLFETLAEEWWKIQCCKILGKYLETQGVMENRSGYSDMLYYTPDVLRQNLRVKSERLIRLS